MKKLSILLPFLFLISCGEDSSEGAGGPQAMPVQVAAPYRETVTHTRTFTGRFVPVEMVEVRARVSGYIDKVHFKEGDHIEKGDLMFQIDPSLFDAEVARSEAVLAQAKSAEVLAEQNYKRASDLVEKRAMSREEADIRSNELTRAKADVQVAEASLEMAKLNQGYARIEAPISGITSSVTITEGNYIVGGGPTADVLTTVIPHTPIYCEFEVDEQQVLQFTRMFFDGEAGGRGSEPVEVEISVSDTDEFGFKGRLTFGDNRLDSSTATMRMRAMVDNEGEFLTPGLFARVRIPIGKPTAALFVKDAALGFDQSKRFAWVLKEDNTLERRYVEVGDLHGDQREIEGGLSEDEKIAVSGIQLLRPGVPVEPMDAEMK